MDKQVAELKAQSKSLYFFLVAIIVLIGFQQFPVIRVGGSFKIYELLALLIIFRLVFGQIELIKEAATINYIALFFFFISPIISYLCSLIAIPYPYKFFIYYPQVESFKFNYYIFPILQLIYMLFNYTTMIAIVNNQKIYENFNFIIKLSIIVGTFIALYSLFAMFIGDPIAQLPSFIQNKKKYDFRSVGLSQEPSFYVLYQGWIFLFCVYSGKLFSNKIIWIILLFINFVSLILTQSTALIGFFSAVFLSIFLLRNSVSIRVGIVLLLLVFAGIIYYFLIKYNYSTLFVSYFVDKLNNFFVPNNNTIGSGSFRNYTSRIGIEIFKNHYITGVGVGNSIYHMFPYEFKMGIVIFGERLFAGCFPQNLFSLVLSEQGMIGFMFLMGLLAFCFIKFWKYRNESPYHKMFFIGFLFNVSAMISVAPQYSLFIWVFISLGIGFIYFYKKTTDESLLLQ